MMRPTIVYPFVLLASTCCVVVRAGDPAPRNPRVITLNGGDYAMTRYTIDSGAALIVGNGYALTGTVGQPDADRADGGGYALSSGFWYTGGSTGGECTTVADCADLDDNGVRDDACVWWACIDGTCTAMAIDFADMVGQFGECTPDGATDGNDRFGALNCFANENPNGPGPYPCEAAAPVAYNVDAGGQFGSCVPDGVCDGNDAFLALGVFDGSSTCTCAAGPAPTVTPPPSTVGLSPIVGRATSTVIHPGDRVDIELFLDRPLADLRGYQLHIGIAGGTRGALRLSDILIEERDDNVFDGLSTWHAFNLRTRQLVVGMDSAGVATRPRAYLATLRLAASADAAGRFVIDVLSDPSDPDQRTYLFPTAAGAAIEIPDSASVTVTVGAGSKCGEASIRLDRP